MKIYNFDTNGIYQYESVADESPLEKGVFLIPFNATSIAPPIVSANEQAIFKDGVWQVFQIAELLQPTTESLRQIMNVGAAELRLRLVNAGLYVSINATINALADDSEVKIKWEYSTFFKRLDPVLTAFFKDVAGLTDEQLDNFFKN